MTEAEIPVESVETSVYTIPTDSPEADGTFAWTDTTMVLVQIKGGGRLGTGYTYGSAVTGELIKQTLAPLLVGRTFASVRSAWSELVLRLRNIGRPGIGSMAVSALDCALWDLAARLVDQPLHTLLGAVRDRVPLYGSGGFTTYTPEQTANQVGGWLAEGFVRVKIKIGEDWGCHDTRDLERISQVRELIGPDVDLFVDANGGYTVAQALRLTPIFEDLDVVWFEEPVSSDDLAGLRSVRDGFRGDVAAGEYGYDLAYFRHMCDAQAVDCVQVDVTRCGGISELLRIAALAEQCGLEVSGHCAPYQHAPVLAAVPNMRHLEWFHDHVRIEQQLFERAATLTKGELVLADDAPGNGLTWRPEAAEQYRVG
jgi:L-alanine-DL-glutamate epimerase-like enolase superfamily enzyme